MEITPTPTPSADLAILTNVAGNTEMTMYLIVIAMGVIVGCTLALILSHYFSNQ